MSGRLAGKTAFMTASAQGIGRATALAFAAEGARVFATDLNIGKLTEIAGGNITVARLDVLDADAVKAMAAEVGPVDLIFNCAGYVHQGTILDATEAEWDFGFNLNVRSTFRVIQAFLDAIIEELSQGNRLEFRDFGLKSFQGRRFRCLLDFLRFRKPSHDQVPSEIACISIKR